jgi:hypothetical protein
VISRKGARTQRKNRKEESDLNKAKTDLEAREHESGDMSAEEFRRFGHELVDWIANYFERIEELPVLAQIEPGDLKAQLPSTPPAQGEPMEAILTDLLFRLLRHFNFSSWNFRRALERGFRRQVHVVANFTGLDRAGGSRARLAATDVGSRRRHDRFHL